MSRIYGQLTKLQFLTLFDGTNRSLIGFKSILCCLEYVRDKIRFLLS